MSYAARYRRKKSNTAAAVLVISGLFVFGGLAIAFVALLMQQQNNPPVAKAAEPVSLRPTKTVAAKKAVAAPAAKHSPIETPPEESSIVEPGSVPDPNIKGVVEQAIADGLIDGVQPEGVDQRGWRQDAAAMVSPAFQSLPFAEKQRLLDRLWRITYPAGTEESRQIGIHDRSNHVLGAYSPSRGLHLRENKQSR